MTASIIEYPDGSSIVVATGQDDEHHVFNIMETDSQEELGQADYEFSLVHAVFNYALLGDPNANAEENSEDIYECEDGYACVNNKHCTL